MARLAVALPFLLTISGCTLALPDPIFKKQVDATYTKLPLAADPLAVIVADARACAGHLNALRTDARVDNAVKVLVTALGAAASGTGGAVAALSSDAQQQKNGGIAAGIGAVVALAGTFVVSLFGDATDRLTRHDKGVRSWDDAHNIAIDMLLGNTRADVRRLEQDLQNCAQDLPPPTSLPTQSEVHSAPQ